MSASSTTGEVSYSFGDEVHINLHRYSTGEPVELTEYELVLLDAVSDPDSPYRMVEMDGQRVATEDWNPNGQNKPSRSIEIFGPEGVPSINEWRLYKSWWLNQGRYELQRRADSGG